ncbi:MAG: glycosyltransferase family 4 protein, partial [bacterium]
MREKLKILHIIKLVGVYGAERHLQILLPRLNREKYDITLLALLEPSNPMDGYLKKMSHSGVSTSRIFTKKSIDLPLVLKLARFIASGNYKIVHTHLLHADLYGVLAAKLVLCPIIVSSKHYPDAFYAETKAYRAAKFVGRFVNQYIAISKDVVRHCVEDEQIPPEKVKLIYYALEMSNEGMKFSIRDELGIKKDEIVLVIVGRLEDVKGHKYLIQAMKLLKDKGLEPKLVVLGDGTLRKGLQTLAGDSGLSDNIFFIGYRDDVHSVISDSDIFVLPTLGEGFGLAILEAMACGKPVISTNIMCVPEVVADGESGILVKTQDEKSL